MKKGLLLGLFAVSLALVISGCSAVTSAATTTTTSGSSTSSTTTVTGSTTSTTMHIETGTITTEGTSEAVLSGTISIDAGSIDINLNAVIVSGEPISGLTAGNFQIRIAADLISLITASTLEVTIPGTSVTPLDIVFILDVTGSMGDTITGAKNSIIAFASSIEAAGGDARFGLVTFGDSSKHPTPPGLITDEGSPEYYDAYSYTREVMALGTAAALQATLEIQEADYGGDGAENPLDAIMWGYNNMAWRTGSQKVFIVITDIYSHQSTDLWGKTSDGGNRCTTSFEAVASELFGKAAIHVVSPDYIYDPDLYYLTQYKLLDSRRLADGKGQGQVTGESGTGGKWLTFEASGEIDLTQLGISQILTAGYKLQFNFSFTAGVWYIWLRVDADNDGIYESNMVIPVTITLGASSASTAFGSQPKAAAVTPVAAPRLARPPYVSPPNN